MIARLLRHRGALALYALTGFANVLAFGYQFVMPRLLTATQFAALTQLFGILLVESIGTQVIQLATAKLAAQYRAREDAAALHVFVRRWTVRLLLFAAVPSLAVIAAAPLIAPAVALSTLSVAMLGATLFLAILSTFVLGLLQGLQRFVALGSGLVLQAAARLGVGAALVLGGMGVDGAFAGAAAAVLVTVVFGVAMLRELFRRARASTAAHLAPGETRFFALAGVVVLAYAGLTNLDAVLARPLLGDQAGAYSAAVTLGKVILFAPIAVAFILLERTARAHERGLGTERGLFVALGFVLATSGAVAAGYVVAPALFTSVVVGTQYPGAVALVPTYAVAALSNALLSIWNAYFIGRGRLGVGWLLAAALAIETGLLVTSAHDALTMARIVAGVAVLTQLAAAATFLAQRRRA